MLENLQKYFSQNLHFYIDIINKYVNDEETKELLAKWSDYIAENKGYDEGRKDEKVEIAKKMLEKGNESEDISKVTGLNIEEIENLREEE